MKENKNLSAFIKKLEKNGKNKLEYLKKNSKAINKKKIIEENELMKIIKKY